MYSLLADFCFFLGEVGRTILKKGISSYILKESLPAIVHRLWGWGRSKVEVGIQFEGYSGK